jgi:acyl-CoA thioester hydrolase
MTEGPYGVYAEAETTVEFFHCDPMRVVWHGNYVDFFELGRRALLDKIGYSYEEMAASGFAFPVIEIQVKYTASLHFKDKVVIRAVLSEYENRLRIEYEVRNGQTGVVAAKGRSTQMAFDMAKNESCFVCPNELTEKVKALIADQAGKEKT